MIASSFIYETAGTSAIGQCDSPLTPRLDLRNSRVGAMMNDLVRLNPFPTLVSVGTLACAIPSDGVGWHPTGGPSGVGTAAGIDLAGALVSRARSLPNARTDLPLFCSEAPPARGIGCDVNRSP